MALQMPPTLQKTPHKNKTLGEGVQVTGPEKRERGSNPETLDKTAVLSTCPRRKGEKKAALVKGGKKREREINRRLERVGSVLGEVAADHLPRSSTVLDHLLRDLSHLQPSTAPKVIIDLCSPEPESDSDSSPPSQP